MADDVDGAVDKAEEEAVLLERARGGDDGTADLVFWAGPITCSK